MSELPCVRYLGDLYCLCAGMWLSVDYNSFVSI